LDIENDRKTDDSKLDKEKILRGVETWLKIVENETGVRPLIYTNLDYYKRYIAGERFQAYPVWIAGYSMKNVKLPDGRDWWFWQVSESARVKGISEKVDFNVFSGNTWQLQAICKR
jgi:lysozyme